MTTKAQAVVAQLSRELGRRGLTDFCSLLYPGFQQAPHLRFLADLLECAERGDLKKLIFTVAPGSGKSTLLQLFASWFIGRNPKRKIIEASAGAELAERNSRAARGFIVDDAWPFSGRLSTDTRSMNRWSMTDGGGLFAIGTGGTVTGWRADLIIADDLQNSAGTPGERDALWAWFREVLQPRLEPQGSLVMVCTRWSDDDLVGRILDAPDGNSWLVVNIPAIAEEGDVLGRPLGAPMWPERFGIAELNERKAAMGTRAFETQFLGRPVPIEGALIKTEWLKRYDRVPEHFDKVVMALDSAAKTGVSNDYSAICVLGVTGNAAYVLDVIRRKVEFPDLIKLVLSAYEKWKPSAIYIEDTSNAVALLQVLKNDTHLPVIARKPVGSKISRVEGISGTLEAGRVILPNEAPWLLEFERELLGFPNVKHDDMVDAFVLAVAEVMVPKNIPLHWGSISREGPAIQTIYRGGLW